MNVDYSATRASEITGRVETVLSRGGSSIDDGEYRGAPGTASYPPRGTCQYLRW